MTNFETNFENEANLYLEIRARNDAWETGSHFTQNTMSNQKGRRSLEQDPKSSLLPCTRSRRFHTHQGSRQGYDARPKIGYIGESYLYRIIPQTGTDPPTFFRPPHSGVRMMKVLSGTQEK